MSQLGYMVLALGIGSYQAALFHLITHAYSKAFFFLSMFYEQESLFFRIKWRIQDLLCFLPYYFARYKTIK